MDFLYPDNMPPFGQNVTFYLHPRGHVQLRWWDKASRSGRRIYYHIYLWQLENGPVPSGHVIHHRDRNKRNNNLNNLELMTVREHNVLHHTKHGRTITDAEEYEREKRKRYYESHKAQILAAKHEEYKKNRDKYVSYSRQYREANIELCRERNRRCAAKRRTRIKENLG
jgi:hypothetical protein